MSCETSDPVICGTAWKSEWEKQFSAVSRMQDLETGEM